MTRFAVAFVSALALAGCATAGPPPQPRALILSPGVWRLSFEAPWAPGARIGALRRAADLTLAEGGDWFRVLSREHGADGEGWGFGEGVGEASDLLSDPGPLSVSTLEIEIGRGAKPSDRDAYDAHAVAALTRGARPTGAGAVRVSPPAPAAPA